MNLQSILLSFFFSFSLVACTKPQSATNEDPVSNDNNIQYATGFQITHFDDVKRIEVVQPFKGSTQSLTYWLVPKSASIPDSLKDKVIIRTPLENLVCTSTTHIAPLDLLGESNKLIGFPSTQYISSDLVRAQVDNGTTREVGRDNNLNIEVMLDLSPQVLMTYSLTGDYSKLTPFQRSGITVVQNAEYLEKTPLGRAEWIKFMATFFDKENEADSIFEVIADNYQRTLKLVEGQQNHPTIFSGIVYGDTWFMPGGGSWAGKFFKDSGSEFLWKETPESGSLELSFEAVFEKAHKAEYWIGVANYFSLEALTGADQRYASFDAFTKDQVYTYNARQIPNGGNDYFESGFSRPDIVLNDLVKIVHPNLLPNYTLYYYRKLE